MALIYFYDTTPLDEEQLIGGLQQTDHSWTFVHEGISLDNLNPETEVISVFVSSTVTREMIERLPRLRLIACRSTGFNNIDLTAAEERDIAVVNVPTYGESTVAEYTFTLMLALSRKLPASLVTNTDVDLTKLVGSDLHEKTLGVIGTGHIGQHVVEIARGFSMRIIAFDAFPREGLDKELGFEYCSLEDVLAKADFVTLHTPYLPSTHHLMNSERFKLMKPDAVLVNTARGELVDTKALLEALQTGTLGGAALDVVEGEALLHPAEEMALLRSNATSNELYEHSVEISLLQKMPNVILTPHNAFNTVEAVGRINATTIQNIHAYWYGDVPNRVKPPEKTFGKLIVSRHAESEWNATGQWSGIRDVHLSEKGFKEAGMLGRALKEIHIPLSIAYCSEQIRTRETLEGILEASQQFNVEVVRDGALNERDYGDYTGKNKWDMKAEIGEDAWNAVRRGWDVPVPNGETLKMVYERVQPFYMNTILPLLKGGANVLLVAHGNSIRALIKYIESIDDEGVGDIEMLFGDILVYDVNENGLMQSKHSTHIDSPAPNA